METTKIKMNMDGTFRAKVLQYKSDGNTLTEKWHTLTKFAEGIYFSHTTPDRYGHRSVNVIFSKNGIFWRVGGAPENYFNPESFRYAENMDSLKKRYANYEADITQAITNGGWINMMHITVMKHLGHDIEPLLAARKEYIRKREEEDRQREEAAAKAEQERMEAEERRKADVLADGKEKLLKHERITVEQIELIAEAVGYKINIRTIGFMREKVTEAVLREDDTVTVWGRKLTSRNIDGTAKVMRELYKRLKAQAEEEAKKPIKHISEIMGICRLHDEVTGEETDEYKYYKWLTYCHASDNYMTIADKALAEVLAWIFEAAYRKGKGHIIAKNKDGVLLETVIASQPAETPRISTEAAETVNVSAEEEEEEAERAICAFISKAETTLDKIKQKCLNREIYVEDASRYEFMVCMAVSNFVNKHKNRPHTAATVTRNSADSRMAADTPKPRETARKPQNRDIGSKRTTQRDTLRNTLRPTTYVPRECPTADTVYW